MYRFWYIYIKIAHNSYRTCVAIILSNRILLATSSLLASYKLLNLLFHSSCSKHKGGKGEVEDGVKGEVEGEDEE